MQSYYLLPKIQTVEISFTTRYPENHSQQNSQPITLATPLRLSKLLNLKIRCIHSNIITQTNDIHDTTNPLYNIPTSPHNNTQTIPPNVGTYPRCVRRRNKRRFPPDIFPLPFGHKCASVALDFRTYQRYVPTTDTTLLTLNFAFRYHRTTTHKQSQAVGTHPRCVRREATGGFRPTFFRSRSNIKKPRKISPSRL